ncbi:MAG: SCO family protein [Flammeovirgaceae bacterium]|nr:SCO family protein [Flammeovirgaceae bacterium]MDW8288103.1 SCO family protein [Flammeovirgaceae bacterium]
MNKVTKLVILGIVFIVPILIILFLHLFGKNQYDVPAIDLEVQRASLQVYNPQSVNCPPSTGEDGIHRIPDFSFLNQDSVLFTQENLKGKVYVADFIFTRCPDICLSMTSELVRVYEKLHSKTDFMIVSHTVDPEYDTPSVLRKYAIQYDIDTQKGWHFLTGDKEKIYNLAACGYFIAAKPAEPQKINFVHSDKLVLVDRNGRIRGYYSGTNRDDVDRLITEALILLQNP